MKKIVAVLTLMFLLSFFVSSINATENRLIYNLAEWEGLVVEIYAPYQAYPNDNMTIRIRVEARTEELRGVTVSLKIYGSRSEGYILWPRRLDALTNEDFDLGRVEDQYFNVSIPDDVDPGLLHALISCSWKVWRESSWQERSIDDWCIHRVTYLGNKPYEDLQVAYDQLLANYSQLLADYKSLLASHSDLENSYADLQANHSALLMNYGELLANYNSLESSFNSTQNDYNNLQTSYDSLNSTYHSLMSDYSSLQASFNELKSRYEFGGEMANALNLMYVFIETTVIFIATTIYYARAQIYNALRKLKPKGRKVIDVNHAKE